MFIPVPTVDNLAILDIAAVNLALSGAFDDRIKELRELLAKQAENDAIKITYAEVIEREGRSTDMAKALSEREVELSERALSLQAFNNELHVTESLLAEERNTLESAIGVLEKDRRVFEASVIARNQELDDFKSNLDKRQGALELEALKLTAQKRDLNAKLDSLRP